MVLAEVAARGGVGEEGEDVWCREAAKMRRADAQRLALGRAVGQVELVAENVVGEQRAHELDAKRAVLLRPAVHVLGEEAHADRLEDAVPALVPLGEQAVQVLLGAHLRGVGRWRHQHGPVAQAWVRSRRAHQEGQRRLALHVGRSMERVDERLELWVLRRHLLRDALHRLDVEQRVLSGLEEARQVLHEVLDLVPDAEHHALST